LGSTSAARLQSIATRLVMLQTGMRSNMGIKVKGPDLAGRSKNALLRRSPLRRRCVGLIDPCSTALQGRLRRLDFALLASPKMASSRYGPF
jgi:Cu(I)/Ag(I) efflux system membrane protein CusA/SilA